ncbi:protein-tyrosine phosphatase family protein [Tahibacter soli]|jgi:protein-tyrosine phosphatase|uniref:Tyrosine specific protein phosphatases domain-containing protein n=1 Tax=Tahibacter soli TaxID=2983605 RepID=A0A9X3YPY5_9GAMM|nr:protein-tyrosine phosphatase family protein [Tahibacter soli]MDC8015722.1 hypothetical protein [Tahibacter soli]
MRPDVYWVSDVAPLRLAIAPRPRAGEWLEDEFAGWRRDGVDVVVSLLEAHEARDLDLADEARLCARYDIDYIGFPIPDRGVPERHDAVRDLADALVAELRAGRGVVLHCRAGIGRSGLIAACVLSRLGHAPPSAFAMLARARGTLVPDTDAQSQWAAAFHRAGLNA